MDRISFLVVTENIEKFNSNLPFYVDVTQWSDELIGRKEYFDIVLLDKNVTKEVADTLFKITHAYCLFYLDTFGLDLITKNLVNQRVGTMMSYEDFMAHLRNRAKDYFSKPYGEKAKPEHVAIAQGFKGSVKWHGQYSVELDGEYGEEFNQILFWRNNIPIFPGQALDYWIEYKKDPTVEINFELRKFVSGSIDVVDQIWRFSEEDMQDIVTIENNDTQGVLFASINAKGSGKLQLIASHDRYSRRGLGSFLVGGERFVTSDREEIFAYFDPGDFKPPLKVYFSGFKTQEGFEGYYMMRKMGGPFLLIAEQRLTGGGFYMGSPEFESLMVSIIRKYMDKLGFNSSQLILSGISMGAMGSMYYGCDLKPYALIIGKPLASLGDIAENERLNRPGGFPTSLDMLRYYGDGMGHAQAQKVNDRFWNKLKNSDFSHTKIIVSYMYEDDYDSTAYEKLLGELNSEGVQVYGKGLHGRHNDNTDGIATWFKGQYNRILKEDFI